jgi:hypothetical protein
MVDQGMWEAFLPLKCTTWCWWVHCITTGKLIFTSLADLLCRFPLTTFKKKKKKKFFFLNFKLKNDSRLAGKGGDREAQTVHKPKLKFIYRYVDNFIWGRLTSKCSTV